MVFWGFICIGFKWYWKVVYILCFMKIIMIVIIVYVNMIYMLIIIYFMSIVSFLGINDVSSECIYWVIILKLNII